MFEQLTADEAGVLMVKLTSSYNSSLNLACEIAGWKDATTSIEMRMSYARDLNAQARIRSENTSLRWQLRREAAK